MSEPSRLDDYRAQAEQVHEDLVRLLPNDRLAADPVIQSSARIGDTSSATTKPSDPARWQVNDDRTFVDAGSAHRAGLAVTEYLTGEGWSRQDEILSNDSTIVTGFRKSFDGGQWYMSLVYPRSEQGASGNFHMLIDTPWTTRGNYDGYGG